MSKPRMARSIILAVLLPIAPAFCERPPGVVINHMPASTKIYIGSPGIAVLSDGVYLAKHDEFGPGSTERDEAVTQVFRSSDRGNTWSHLAAVRGMYWASIFVHGRDAYLMGTSRYHGSAVISRSTNGGATWTVPRDSQSGLLLRDAEYHCAPVPIVVHKGRIWRAMEDAMGPGGWGTHFHAFMMSARADSDLLKASNWLSSNRLARNGNWLDGKFRGWLEGNAVLSPDDRIVNILRVDCPPEGGKAAIIEISEDGRKASFDPERGFVDFPGGSKKFTIRYHPASKAYWTLSNPVLPKHEGNNPGRVRNALALMRSSDLQTWEIRCILLYHPDIEKHGFQYVDWLFESDDIIAASRTAYGQGSQAAHNQHDANYLTFHRFANFRELTMADSAPSSR